ncbi:MAG: MerR family transcriptional regulator [Clostridia bacterium]|nr:MerR family transcriptional regulator [Clostridia bacterium]
MTIKDVCEKFGITADTLRYYEKVGAIPKVARSSGGIREYDNEALNWVHNAVCLRKAGVSVEAIAEYVRLFNMGDETIKDRLALLLSEREELGKQLAELTEAVDLLDWKISRYRKAVETGVLTWDKEEGE